MKKHYFYGIAAALMMGTVALSSCSSDELAVGNETQIAKEVAKTYSFSIQATMDDEAGTRVFGIGESTISSSFSTEEPVNVFIEKSDGSNNIAYGDMTLSPTNVSDNGSSCTINVENLTWIPKETGFKVEVGDKVYLYYGMSVFSGHNLFDGWYDFATDGSKATAEKMDYNLAEMVVTDVDDTGKLTFGQKDDNTKTNFSFKNINSIFRQKLTFKKGATEVTPENVTITITSSNNKIVVFYKPFGGTDAYEYDHFEFLPDLSESDGNIYFSTIFNEVNKNDAIIFTAYDADSNTTYTCTKAAPSGGFQNNMYYYGEAILGKEGIPAITGADGIEADELGLFYLEETLTNPITISGNSNGFAFELDGYAGPITLNNVNATFLGDYPFIHDEPEHQITLELILTGDNSLTCLPNIDSCISVGELKLSCTGESATLTLTSNERYSNWNQYYYGIFTNDYNPEDGGPGNDDLTVLAATGFTVTRSLPTDNGDGTFTWTYTVTKNP